MTLLSRRVAHLIIRHAADLAAALPDAFLNILRVRLLKQAPEKSVWLMAYS